MTGTSTSTPTTVESAAPNWKFRGGIYGLYSRESWGPGITYRGRPATRRSFNRTRSGDLAEAIMHNGPARF